MQKIFYSELLKLQHLGTTKFLIIIPFLTVLIAFLMGGLQIFVPFSVYWWEAIFLYLVNGVLFIVDRRLEDQAGHFQNVTNVYFTWKIILMNFRFPKWAGMNTGSFILIKRIIERLSRDLIMCWQSTAIPFLFMGAKRRVMKR